MRLFQDIGTYLGAGSVPVIVGGFVYGVFKLGEKLASPQAKAALTHWLQTADVRKVAGLPQYTMEIFERVFGERHLSLKCLWRSAAFSVASILVIFLLIEIFTSYMYIKEVVSNGLRLRLELEFFVLWLSWAICTDYVSLYKTRIVVRFLIDHELRILPSIIVLATDLVVYNIIFSAGALVTVSTLLSIEEGWGLAASVAYSVNVTDFSSIGMTPFNYKLALGPTAFWTRSTRS
jgi:hypothetical protein